MYIKELELKNYRNYKELKISFDEKVNLILGDNAQGKTNLIEAIYISSLGKSFKSSKDLDYIKFNEDNAYVKVIAVKEDFDTEVEIILEKKGKSTVNKNIKKDKKRLAKTSELIKNILIVVFSPEDLKLVKEDPEKRRRFLDRELCQISPSYYECYTNYRRILLQRNTYLKENDIKSELLDLWDTQLSQWGAKIIHKRRDFIEKISEISNKIHNNITSREENLRILYNSNIRIEDDLEDQEYTFYTKIKESFDSDLINRSTTRGPHRDDIEFLVNNINMRSFGSQGQQRTCALSLKLAELNLIKEETGEDAILLLDDVMSELDIRRQEYLIKTLDNNQLFITTTDIDKNILGRLERATIYSISNGSVVNIEKK